ncbi:Hypothetical protein P9215_14621 [Prochlorococcus marinus str. MIT 9215]|uniref:Uncharacterized protein n=2 Tax=Prochlorococcus marinus TaxID=1219 RepID=A8G644_PROM2|nr:Hypothetical protein P9215_14621 [Prochlorococcus marinus str. MIT 9215]
MKMLTFLGRLYPERVFRKPRVWSNNVLRSFANIFEGEVINVSGWEDEDKEGGFYKDYFKNCSSYKISNYGETYRGNLREGDISIDLEKELNSNLESSADVVFNHTTLEHVFDIFMAVKNLAKITRDILILVVPAVQEEHGSEGFKDYWRFNIDGISKLLEKNKLEIVYFTSNHDSNTSIYHFIVASKNPKKWKGFFKDMPSKINRGEKIVKVNFLEKSLRYFINNSILDLIKKKIPNRQKIKILIFLRFIYRFINQRKEYYLNKNYCYREYFIPGENIFFGYHDLDPFSVNNEIIIACKTKQRIKSIINSDLELGYFNLNEENGKFHYVDSTSSWCWQQGCRLQWFNQSQNSIIFNTKVNNKIVSKVVDIFSKDLLKVFDRPIYSQSPNKKFFVSLDFYRLEKLRPGYGYQNSKYEIENQFAPKDDGLWLIDTKNGFSKLIINYSEIYNHKKNITMDNAYHYFNHVIWSPDSKKFFFLHLWLGKSGQRYARAFIWNNELKEYKLLIDNCLISHHAWLNNEKLLVYTDYKSEKMSYKIINLNSLSLKNIKEPLLKGDGHPFCSQMQNNIFITDTYPDKFLEQSLLFHDINKKETKIIGKFYSPPKFRYDYRCDLHPRLSSDGNFIAIDSGHKGQRALIVLEKL